MSAEQDFSLAAMITTTAGVVAEAELPVDLGDYDQLIAAHFIPSAALGTPGITNFATLQIRDVTQNPGAPVVLASIALTQALVIDTPVEFVLAAGTKSSTTIAGQTELVAATAVSQKDVLDVFVVQTGTGSTLPASRVELELQ